MNAFPDFPADAESVSLLDHLHLERVPSKHIAGGTVAISTVTCPGCKVNLGRPRHLEVTVCKCGLSVVPNGTEIVIWRAAPAAAE